MLLSEFDQNQVIFMQEEGGCTFYHAETFYVSIGKLPQCPDLGSRPISKVTSAEQ